MVKKRLKMGIFTPILRKWTVFGLLLHDANTFLLHQVGIFGEKRVIL